jgi:DNA processing protein
MSGPPLPHASSSPDLSISPSDAAYPEEFRELGEHAPTRIFARGSLGVLERHPRVAIVGTRRATGYGLRVTRELAAAFARAGAVVVSGMASGIDGAAHRSTLEEGGLTIGVLGTGLNQVYPKGHRDLQREVADRGLLLTELAADDHGMKFTFVHRNRLIAALCSVVIVIEAPERSGALNTVNHALDLGRTIAAVPGPIDQPQSAGANGVIREGGHIITSIEDALALVGLTPPPRVPRGDPLGDAGKVWTALGQGALDIDALCARTGLPAAQCLAAVTELEVAGSIECAFSGVIRRR